MILAVTVSVYIVYEVIVTASLSLILIVLLTYILNQLNIIVSANS